MILSKLETDYPEHLNGNIPQFIVQFNRLQIGCEQEIRKYARNPFEIDLPPTSGPVFVQELLEEPSMDWAKI